MRKKIINQISTVIQTRHVLKYLIDCHFMDLKYMWYLFSISYHLLYRLLPFRYKFTLIYSKNKKIHMLL